MASGLAALGAAFAVAGGWIGPGLAAATALDLGRDRLERAVLGVAIGRLLLALATLAATTAGAGRALAAWAVLGLGTGAWALARSRRTLAPTRDGVGWPLAWGGAWATFLVTAVVFRSALDLGPSGVLAFFGRDSANDPFVYGAHALALRDRGLPLASPFAGGAAVPGSYVPFAVLAGLSAIGAAPMIDLVYRVVPLVECAALMATAIALVRALGAPTRAAWLAPLALLAGDPSPIVAALARLAGAPVHAIDSFALFGPYLLAVNPITPGLQTLFCAWVLLARAPRRAEAMVAGLLVAALFEIKLFLWAPAIAGLVATALVRPPPPQRAPLRTAALAALAGSLPSLLDKLRFAARAAAHDDTGFSLCLGCLPRYLARAAWGDGELSFAIFRAGTPLAPRALAIGAVAAVAIAVIALGARALALPKLARGVRAGDVPSRWLAIAGAVGLALAMTVGAPPHYLNAAQFAWVATFGLAPLLAIACAEWIAAGRWLPLALATLLAVPGAADALLRLGWAAPERFAISAAERELCAELARRSAPGDVVFEPSMIRDTDVPSPIPLLAGRPVYLSLLSAVSNLPPDERDARFARLAAFFAGTDAAAARRALAESGAALVFAPAASTANGAASADLVPIFENAAGRLYRVPTSASLPP